MFKIAVEAATLTDLAAKLLAAADALGGGNAPTTAATTTTTKPPKDDKPSLDYDTDVRPLVVKLSKDHGRDVALGVLQAFQTEGGDDCTKGQEVQPKDWPALVKAVNAAQKKFDKEKAEAVD
jgi:hypothetical protein